MKNGGENLQYTKNDSDASPYECSSFCVSPKGYCQYGSKIVHMGENGLDSYERLRRTSSAGKLGLKGSSLIEKTFEALAIENEIIAIFEFRTIAVHGLV
jgi:hypothetical protein